MKIGLLFAVLVDILRKKFVINRKCNGIVLPIIKFDVIIPVNRLSKSSMPLKDLKRKKYCVTI